MAPAVLCDDETLQRTFQLINFLARVTDSVNRNPHQDIYTGSAAPKPLVWLDDLPDGIEVRLDADGDDAVLAMRPVPLVAPPAVPVELKDRVDPATVNDIDHEPSLDTPGPDDPGAVADEERMQVVFARWLAGWRSWAADERPRRLRRRLYDQLETAAKKMEQHDDEFECVIATGLLCWKADDGTAIRRHLLTEAVRPTIDRRTAEVRIARTGGHRRMENAEVFHNQPCYLPERGRGHREALLASELPMDSTELQNSLRDWLGLSIAVAVDHVTSRPQDGAALPALPQLSASPAFLMRPRSQVLIAEAYQRIAAELQDADAAVPVGLAQLVVDTEPAQRNAWLAGQGAASGDLLGEDPLFPLKANDEQQRVMDLLRTETGVVVQGPPGTGKTHTIANLVSALLARGQRVLVTSQKDQALKVLRDKIPSELRHLCVLLAGGSRTAAADLQRGLDAFSAAQAGADRTTLLADARRLSTERDNLRGRAATVNRDIAQLREIENQVHGPAAPGFSTDLYRGPLVQIVRDVQRGADTHDWMPPVPAGAPDRPPLGHTELLELLELLRLPEAVLDARAGQQIPGPDELPPVGFFADRLDELGRATATVDAHGSALSRRLAALGASELGHLEMLSQQAEREMVACGLSATGAPTRAAEWVVRAIADRFAGRRTGLWGHLLEVRDEARLLQQRLQAQGVRFVVEVPDITPANLGTAKGWLNAGNALLEHVRGGGKFRSIMQKKVQRDAQPLLEAVRVDGGVPGTADQLTAVLNHLGAAVATVQLAQKWAMSNVPIAGGPLPALLSELADNAAHLDRVEKLAILHGAVVDHLARCGLSIDVSTVALFVDVLGAIPAARQQHILQEAEQRLRDLQARVRGLAGQPGACAELADLLSSVMAGDPQAYGDALAALETARQEQAAHRRLHELLPPIASAHPELAAEMRRTAHEESWPRRLAAAGDAWAWSIARRFVAQQRNADRERELTREFEQLDGQLDQVTKRLVHARSMLALLDRMSDAHARALNSYRAHMSKIGAGTGKKTAEFRRAARASMRKAQAAVPAWVVPLPNLLENLDANKDSFDVVIVDEASQVGIEHLYLLWMAPRVIVVGDDKQCTPGPGRLGDLDWLFGQNDTLMPDIDHDIRRLEVPPVARSACYLAGAGSAPSAGVAG